MNGKLKFLSFLTFLSILVSFLFCYFYSFKNIVGFNFSYNFITMLENINFWIRFILVFLLLFFIQLHFIFDINKLYGLFYKSRYYIAGAIILFAVVFELNNSSIDLWNILYDDKDQISDIIFGKARWARTDEFQIYTPMLISQSPDYPYFNEFLRGEKTDVSLIDPQPIKNIISIFRPFLLGFLFLGSAKGLSFFWIVRLVLLFLFTFELLLLITDKNKTLSLFGTFLIAFSPGIHWWFTISGLIEMIIYGELAILMLNRYMLTKNFTKKILMLFVMYICAGSFILVLYPAWQVPCIYVFAAILLWIVIKNYTKFNFNKKDLIPIIFFTVLILIVFYYMYDKSKETIDIIRNTVYPGHRTSLGGERLTEAELNCSLWTHLLRYWGNLFLSITDNKLAYNHCLYAVFFDFFPIGLILSSIVFFIDKNKDKLLILLSAVFVFLSCWCFIGFPQFLADITMLKTSPEYRTIIIWGFLNVFILIRALSVIKFRFSNLIAIGISLILTVLSVIANKYIYQEYMDVLKLVVMGVLGFILFYLVLKNKISKLFITIIAILMIISGLAVNPIQKGIDVVNKVPLANAIRNINNEESGLWIFETGTLTNVYIMNYPIMYGAATFNSTNLYPNLEAFKKIDKENKYFDVYNRHCNIAVNLINNNDLNDYDKFVLVAQEYIIINMTEDDLIDLNIKYILTLRNLSSFNSSKIKFELLYVTSKCAIYKLHYDKA